MQEAANTKRAKKISRTSMYRLHITDMKEMKDNMCMRVYVYMPSFHTCHPRI